jgi:hypothetical protein
MSFVIRLTGERWPVGDQGIAAEDTLHAVEQSLIIYSLTDEGEGGPVRQLHLGPDRAGNLLEVVVLIRDDGIG